MKAEIITIGDEILIGQIIDSNSAWIAEQINLLGVQVERISSIADSRQAIRKALDAARQQADIVILTGGLGPTKDDITKKTLAEYFGTKLVLNRQVLEDVTRLIGKKRGKMIDLNVQQAEVPESCTVLRNPVGTAAAMWFEEGETIFVSLPGVPMEMKTLVNMHLLPRLEKLMHKQNEHIVHKTVLTFGMFESMLAERIADWETNLPTAVKLAYLPSLRNIRLRLSAVGTDKTLLLNTIDTEIEKLKRLIPDLIFGYGNEKIEELIGEKLKKTGKSISTAESCTGGNIAKLISSISGSSAYFKGSVVAYANETKTNVLHVHASEIESYGAVSEQVVGAMAANVRQLLNTDFAIATSGIAGPGGGSKEKPVGTVCLAIASANKLITKTIHAGNKRGRIVEIASFSALIMLKQLLDSAEG